MPLKKALCVDWSNEESFIVEKKQLPDKSIAPRINLLVPSDDLTSYKVYLVIKSDQEPDISKIGILSKSESLDNKVQLKIKITKSVISKLVSAGEVYADFFLLITRSDDILTCSYMVSNYFRMILNLSLYLNRYMSKDTSSEEEIAFPDSRKVARFVEITTSENSKVKRDELNNNNNNNVSPIENNNNNKNSKDIDDMFIFHPVDEYNNNSSYVNSMQQEEGIFYNDDNNNTPFMHIPLDEGGFVPYNNNNNNNNDIHQNHQLGMNLTTQPFMSHDLNYEFLEALRHQNSLISKNIETMESVNKFFTSVLVTTPETPSFIEKSSEKLNEVIEDAKKVVKKYKNEKWEQEKK